MDGNRNSINWGHFEIILDNYLKQVGVSKYKLADKAMMQKTQLKAYCRNQVQRPDLNVLARICLVLNCNLSDIVRYIPPINLTNLESCCSLPKKEIKEIDNSRNNNRIFKTVELAREVSVHPNTIRYYENSGFISPAPRAKNGYREFNINHVYQLKVCRCILGQIIASKMIRVTAMKILESMRNNDVIMAKSYANTHLQMIEKEYAKAIETAVLMKQWAVNNSQDENEVRYTRKQAADIIGITPEVLRNWERNSLIKVPRIGQNNKRVYMNYEITRLKIIYMLRQTNYSISAIHRSLSLHDSGNTAGAILILNNPEQDNEISYISAGDHWLKSLGEAADQARNIINILREINPPS